MKKSLLTLALVALVSGASAQEYALEIPLWPNGPAEENGITTPEVRFPDWTVRNISEGAVYVWPAQGEKTGQAMLICPGGGYSMQAANHEGKILAQWLASQGITAVVLKYRLPNKHPEIPLADAQQAMRIIRSHASEWGVDPARVGVCGFSAGGHLASTLLTHFDEASRPDFGILFYPVVTMKEATHGGSRHELLGENPSAELVERFSNETQVTPETPPTMILFSDDDSLVPTVNGTLFYNALKANKVRAAIHIFPSGEHGWGFGDRFKYHEEMKAAVVDWLAGF